MIRCFLAVFPPPTLAREITRACAQAAGELPSARWVPAENLHLTLEFFGDRTETHVERIRARLLEQCATLRLGSAQVAVGKVGTFRGRSPRVIWLGLRERQKGHLQELRANLVHALAPLGEAVERRAFRPHLTLARPRGRWDAHDTGTLQEALDALEGREFQVEAVSLVASELLPSGARYRVLESLPLRG